MCLLCYTLQKYPPPSVPQDFVPLHKFTVPALKGSDVSDVVTQKPLTSTERTQMLADKPGTHVENIVINVHILWSAERKPSRLLAVVVMWLL